MLPSTGADVGPGVSACVGGGGGGADVDVSAGGGSDVDVDAGGGAVVARVGAMTVCVGACDAIGALGFGVRDG